MPDNRQPLITFTIPCYNSADYLDACVESLIPAGDDIEIILVNDGSQKDNTSEKIHAWESRLPGRQICRKPVLSARCSECRLNKGSKYTPRAATAWRRRLGHGLFFPLPSW